MYAITIAIEIYYPTKNEKFNNLQRLILIDYILMILHINIENFTRTRSRARTHAHNFRFILITLLSLSIIQFEMNDVSHRFQRAFTRTHAHKSAILPKMFALYLNVFGPYFLKKKLFFVFFSPSTHYYISHKIKYIIWHRMY